MRNHSSNVWVPVKPALVDKRFRYVDEKQSRHVTVISKRSCASRYCVQTAHEPAQQTRHVRLLVGKVDDCVRDSSLVARLKGDSDDLFTHDREELSVVQGFADDMSFQQTEDAVISISNVMWNAILYSHCT